MEKEKTLINWDKLESIMPEEGTVGYRICQILAVILVIIVLVAYVVFKFILVSIWFITAIIDLVLFIPCCVLWIFIGKFYGMKMSLYIGEKFKILEVNK